MGGDTTTQYAVRFVRPRAGHRATVNAADSAERLNRYRLESALDGFGESVSAWSAVDAQLQRPVTVTAIDVAPSSDETLDAARAHVVLRLQRAAQLMSNAVLATFDVVEATDLVYVVGESIDAPALRTRVREIGLLSTTEAGELARHLLHAIAEAHTHGVVHGALSPSTVFLFDDTTAKVAGFGWFGDDDGAAGPGDAGYVAPEVAGGGPLSPAVDLWGLGAVLHFAVHGIPPRAPRADFVSAGSAQLDAFIAALLDDDPARRPTATEALAALSSVAPRHRARPPRLAPVTAELPAAPTASSTTATPRPRWRPRIVAAVLIAALLALVVAAAVAWRGDETTTPGVSTTAATTAPPVTSGSATSAPSIPVASPAPSVSRNTVPGGWLLYTDRATGYRIARPDGWAIRSVTAYRTDFVDPASSAFVRVEWTTEPGADPVAAWRSQAASFATRQAGYEELRIVPAVFKGYRAAEWEFRYIERGVVQHALDLGMVTGRYGAALFAVAPDTNWSQMSNLLNTFRATFEPPT